MRKLILKMSITVDAFVSGTNGENDWLFNSMDEGSAEWTLETMRETGLHIMGAKTFRDMASHWPYSTEVYAPLMNGIPKVVFSHDKSITSHTSRDTAQTKEAEDSKNALPLDAATVAKNERSWKEARVMSGDLAKDGRGLPIFSELPKSMALKLVYAKAFEKGAVGHVYQPAASLSK